MEEINQVACTSPPLAFPGLSPGRQRPAVEGVPIFEELLKKKIGTPQEDLAGAALIVVVDPASMAIQPVENAQVEGSVSSDMFAGISMNQPELKPDMLLGIRMALPEPKPDKTGVGLSGLPPTHVDLGKTIESLNAQSDLALKFAAGQVSTNPSRNVDLVQAELAGSMDEHELAANQMVLSEGESPNGQIMGSILRSGDHPSGVAGPITEGRYIFDPNRVVQPAENASDSSAKPASEIKISVEPSAPRAMTMDPDVKSTQEVMVDKKEANSSRISSNQKPVLPEGKVVIPQEANPHIVQAPRGMGVSIDFEPKQSMPQVALAQQLVTGMELMTRQGRSTMHIQLSPQELGAISIHLVSNPQGVTVTVTADQQATGQLMQNQVDHLRQALNDAGVQLTNLNINQQQFSGHANQFSGSFSHTRPERHNSPGERENEQIQSIKATDPMGGGTVDYRI